MKNLVFFAFLMLPYMLPYTQAQQINGGPINVPTSGIIDGITIKEHVPTKRMIPYEFVREADVIWSKRVWQSVDLRQKINHPLYFPFDDYDASNNWVKNSSRWSLWSILKTHVLNGDLRLFSPYNPYQYTITDGDELKYPVDPIPGGNYYTDSLYRTTLFSYLGSLEKQSTTPIPNTNGEDSFIYINNAITYVYPLRDTLWTMSKDIAEYHLKEDWYFDKERGVMDIRIIALAPVVYEKDTEGQITGKKELFWLYFPHCRYILNNYFTYNTHNDAQMMSFDDLFWKRKFNSTIYKESNVFDREITTYKTGVDALFEAERIKEEIRTFEHDVWSF